MRKQNTIESVFERVLPRPNGCWEWQGAKNKKGYGLMRLCGKLVQTHRVAFCAEEGVSIDEISGRVVMHSCDNPSCVNPDHLKVGSHLDNVEDRNGKGRTYRKYSDAEIKSAMQDRSSGMALRDVEAKHGISHQYISKLELGRFTRP